MPLKEKLDRVRKEHSDSSNEKYCQLLNLSESRSRGACMIQDSIKILKSLQHPVTGLIMASHSNVTTGYNLSWIRDTVYQALGLEKFDVQSAIKAIQGLLDVFKKHEYKIDWAIKEKPDARYKYIHARYDPETLNEIHQEWGNKQNDAIGAFLFVIGDFLDKGYDMIRDYHDMRIAQKLVFYLQGVEYWHDADNGMWEENEEVHASSVGACVAGLLKISKYLYVPEQLIQLGRNTLDFLLPRESLTKEVDLALLSLIYPYNIVTEEQKRKILENVEKYLLKERGVIRYLGDKYYHNNGEAEWHFGLSWLSIIYLLEGDLKKARLYYEIARNLLTEKGEAPELYFSRSTEYNENTPLGWSQSMFLQAASLAGEL